MPPEVSGQPEPIYSPRLEVDPELVADVPCGQRKTTLFDINVTPLPTGGCGLDGFDDIFYEWLGDQWGPIDAITFRWNPNPCKNDETCNNKYPKWPKVHPTATLGQGGRWFADGGGTEDPYFSRQIVHRIQRVSPASRDYFGQGNQQQFAVVGDHGDFTPIEPFFMGEPAFIFYGNIDGEFGVIPRQNLRWAPGFPSNGSIVEQRLMNFSYWSNSAAGYIIEGDGEKPIKQTRMINPNEMWTTGRFHWTMNQMEIKYFSCEDGTLVDRTSEAFLNADDPLVFSTPAIDPNTSNSQGLVRNPVTKTVGTMSKFKFTSWGIQNNCFSLADPDSRDPITLHYKMPEVGVCADDTSQGGGGLPILLSSSGIDDWTPEELEWVEEIEHYPSVLANLNTTKTCLDNSSGNNIFGAPVPKIFCEETRGGIWKPEEECQENTCD